MYKISVNNKGVLKVEPKSESLFSVDDKDVTADIVEIRDGIFHIIINNKSYTAEVISHNAEEKAFVIRVNNNSYALQVSDRYDELLKELGLDASKSKKIAELKAPMPGLVVDVSVQAGNNVSKGDKLMVLEAMKMENILKAPADATIKKVNIKKGDTVEKNEVLILFE